MVNEVIKRVEAGLRSKYVYASIWLHPRRLNRPALGHEFDAIIRSRSERKTIKMSFSYQEMQKAIAERFEKALDKKILEEFKKMN